MSNGDVFLISKIRVGEGSFDPGQPLFEEGFFTSPEAALARIQEIDEDFESNRRAQYESTKATWNTYLEEMEALWAKNITEFEALLASGSETEEGRPANPRKTLGDFQSFERWCKVTQMGADNTFSYHVFIVSPHNNK